jgi:tetratricopeptide (TPR) repeat protein
MFHRSFQFFVLCLLFALAGCALFQKTQSSSPVIVDPLIARNQQWREHIETGDSALKQGHLQDAIVAFQAALKIRPNSGEPQYKIAEIYFQLEEYENARDAFIAFLALEPNHITALNYVGFIFEKLSNYEKAVQYYERVLRISKDDLYALNHLGSAYKQLDRLDEAEVQLRKVLALDPNCERPESENLHNYLGLIHLQRGEVGEGIAELRESIRLFPNDVWARQRLGSLYEDHRRYFEAQLQYQQLLEVDPDNLFAVTRLQALAKLQSTPTLATIVSPVSILNPDVSQIIANAPTSNDYPDADVIILFNHFSHDVLPTGQSRYTTHQVVKLLNERGIQKYGDIAIPYQPNAQNIGVNIARTIAPDSTVHLPPDEAFNDVTPPGLLSRNLYSDMMWRVISMVGLAPGVCIEYQVTLEDKLEHVTGTKTWIIGGFNFQFSEVTLETSYALRLPQECRFHWKTENFEIEPKVSYNADGIVSYIWRHGEMPALKLEDGMPHINDIAPRMSYSSIMSWDDVYKWYKGLAKGRYASDKHLQETVEKLTENLRTDEAIIRTLYHFVAKHIRYVGIELGESAYQPSPATEVLQKQYGDCKDKTTLLIAMLDLVGIRAYPVLISTSPYERIDTDLPSLSQFNHMIAAIPTDKNIYIWLDPTSQTCGYGELPYSDQGRMGFLIGNTHGTFVDIPIYPAESNRFVSKTELWLNSKGGVRGEILIHMTGQYNLDARWKYKQVPPSEWKKTLASELSQQFPNIHVDSVNISDVENLDIPVEIAVNFRVDKYAVNLNKQILLPLPIDEFGEYAEIVAAAERTYPLELSYPMKLEKTIRIHLPDGWTAVLPPDYEHTTSFAAMERRYSQQKNLVVYQLTFTLKQRAIPAMAYAEAKQLFNRLASEDGSRLLVNTGQSNASSSTHR